MAKNQFEDNATNALVIILRGDNKAKAKLIFKFLYKGSKRFEDIKSIETRNNLGDAGKPDIIIYFNDNEEYKIEVKDKNSKLTEKEKVRGSRDVFLIPEGYKFKSDINNLNVRTVCWNELFAEVDKSFGGEGFDELELTRHCLGIQHSGSFDDYVSKALEFFCEITKADNTIHFKSKTKDLSLMNTEQGFWIQLDSLYVDENEEKEICTKDTHLLLSFENSGVFLEYDFEGNEIDVETIKKFRGNKYEIWTPEGEDEPKHFICKLYNRSEFMKKEFATMVKKFIGEYKKFTTNFNL